MANKIQFRRDTAANWTSANPTLSQGELGFETDTNKFKLGDGSTAWNSLSYTFNPSITADQNLNTTSNVTFGTVTVPSEITVDRLAKYGAGLSNIELATDDNLTPQTDLRSDLGIPSKRFGNAYINTATVGKVLTDNLYSETGGQINAHNSIWPTGTQNLGALASPWANLYASTIFPTTVTFTSDNTSQTTAWTGTVASSQITSVSTSKVNGLSTVGYTGNWIDLIGAPPSPNQSVDNTSSVQFLNLNLTGGLSVTTGTKVTQIVSSGGYPLDANGQALLQSASTQTPALVVSNYTAGLLPRIHVRGYGQNTPGGGATTAGTSGVTLESSRGTHTSPTAVGSGDSVGYVNFGGYDGSQWASNQSTGWSPFTFAVNSSEAWANNGTTTTNCGVQFIMRAQPPATQLNSTSRQVFMGSSWNAGNTSTFTPPQLNVYLGMTAAQNSNLVNASGFAYGTGSGATSFGLHSVKPFIYGVTNSDTAPDNAGITATNIINFVTNRRSAFAGRRDPLASGDTIFAIQGNVQTAANATGNGSINSILGFVTTEASGSTARGSQFFVQTVNSGTTTLSTKFRVTDRAMNYNSDSHVFSDKNQAFTALSVTTATATFTAIPVMPVYTVATKPASGAVGQMICISDSAAGGNPNGMMAFWDTTNSRWSYIHDNTAV